MSDYKNPTHITISESTKKQYLNKVEQIIKRITREKNTQIIDEYELAMWLIDNAHLINKSTFRLYKSAILFYLYEYINTRKSIEAANYLMLHNSDRSYKKSQLTSSKKSKKIKQDDLSRLIEFLDKKQSKWDIYIKHWILSGILCGLRPVEWRNSSIITHTDGNIALRVKNAKNSNGRANGDYRIILLDGLTEDELNIIKNQLYFVSSFNFNGGYDKFYNDCSARLNYINKLLFGNRKKNITLYSARHQFSANAKFSNCTKSEIAALMGHAVDETATVHYGKKRFGNSMISVSPIKEQVDSVGVTIKKTDIKQNVELDNSLSNHYVQKLSLDKE